MSARRRHLLVCTVALVLMATPRGARAEELAAPALPDPVVPETRADQPANPDPNLDIDLSSVVTSAAKSITTVQEAPAIATVITGEEIQRRDFRFINQALATVPGWMESTINGTSTPIPMVRGVPQAALLLHEGISMFEPWMNFPTFNRSIALETVKRLEVITGPGGVLWGANSFLGIVNMISKDADDVNGLEVSAGYGDGPGDRQSVRTYGMFGKSFFNHKLKIFQHVSYESYLGPVWRLPEIITPWAFGRLVSPEPERSWLVTVDGKYSYGPISLYYSVPVGTMSSQLSFLGPVGHGHMTIFDRYAILEYKQRFLKDRLSIDAKGYYTQFVRELVPGYLPPSALVPPFTDANGHVDPGGLVLDGGGALSQRFGTTVDADLTLPHRIRALVGFELFRESISNTRESYSSPQDPGFFGFVCPFNPDGSLVAGCPRSITNDTDRLIYAAYVDGQWRPVQQLVIDGGVRLQQAFGSRPYKLTPLYSASAAWSFAPAWHLKFNYATGFRPPSFNYTDSSHGGLNWGANPRLLNETSQALQGEINARLLRNVGIFRELQARASYAYTLLENLIEIDGTAVSASYKNTGRRSIHSVEAQSRMYIVGDHFVELGYTYLYSVSTSSGYIRNVPSQWFTLTGSFNIIKHMLDVNTTLGVYSSFDDSNRFVASAGGVPGAVTSAGDTNATYDRISPVAILQLGARLQLLHGKILLNAQVYNVLNQRYWLPDAFNELRPQEHSTPIPAPGLSFFSSITYRPF